MNILKSSFLTLTGLFFSLMGKPLQANQPPNILVIMADDAGYNDFGFQGNEIFKKITPNLDELAAKSSLFTQGYVSASVCGPSRAGFITGKHQQRFGYQENFPQHWSEVPDIIWKSEKWKQLGVPKDESTIGSLLQAAGYNTAVVGKWHLGYSQEHFPTERGFDYFYGFRSGSRSYFPKASYNTTSAIPEKYQSIEENDQLVSESEITYLTDNLSDKAVSYIQNQKNEKAPFFLFLSYTAPHSPMQALKQDINSVRAWIPDASQIRLKYSAMLYRMDLGIGRVLDELSKSDQMKNTMIVFLSDNGGSMKNGSDNGILKRSKWSPYEGGVRVPFLIHMPGQEKSLICEQVISSLDLLPTFLAQANAEIPSDLDGIDLSPFLEAEENKTFHRTLYWRENTFVGPSRFMRSGNEKYVSADKNIEDEFFHLHSDISESNNLSSAYPERLTDLKKKYKAWSLSMPKPRW